MAVKRFFKAVSVVDAPERGEAGAPLYRVLLDGRPVRTPGRRALATASRAVADAVRDEWASQGEEISPEAMPVTKYVNTVLDRVEPHRAAVVEQIAAYGVHDLVCYRADGPAALVSRQAAAWDRHLAWIAEAFDAPLETTDALMPIEQDPAALARLHAAVDRMPASEIAPLHTITTVCGSLVLALAVHAGRLDAEAAWQASVIDEDWQIEQWGLDAEAAARRNAQRGDVRDAAAFLILVRRP